MWASIWFARTAGEGGRGTERAKERARLGVLVRAEDGASSSLCCVPKALGQFFCGFFLVPFVGGLRCAGRSAVYSWILDFGTHPASNSSRALMVCLRALGFFSVGTMPVAGSCFTGDKGSTIE